MNIVILISFLGDTNPWAVCESASIVHVYRLVSGHAVLSFGEPCALPHSASREGFAPLESADSGSSSLELSQELCGVKAGLHR